MFVYKSLIIAGMLVNIIVTVNLRHVTVLKGVHFVTHGCGYSVYLPSPTSVPVDNVYVSSSSPGCLSNTVVCSCESHDWLNSLYTLCAISCFDDR